MTREKAIELAVRRTGRARLQLSLAIAYNNIPAGWLREIRAHFRTICRQYGVRHYNDAMPGSGLK